MGMHWLEENVLSRFIDVSEDLEESVDPVTSPATSSVAAADASRPMGVAMVTASYRPHPKPATFSDLPTMRTTRSLTNRDYYDVRVRLLEFIKRLVDAFEPAGLILLLVGFVKCWRQLGKPYKSALLMITIAVLGGVWIQFANNRIQGRYFLTIVLILLPMAALGLLAIGDRVASFTGRMPAAKTTARRLQVLLLCLLIAIGWGDALSSRHGGRENQAHFAERLSRDYGPFNSVLVNRGAERFGYHALGTVATVKPIHQPIEKLIEHYDPQLMILSRKLEPLPARQAVLDHFARLGWTHVDSKEAETGEKGLIVLRRTAGSRTASGERSRSVH